MFRRKGNGTFLGMENVPDHPPGHIPADSPRHHGNRNGYDEQRADAKLSRLATKQRVRDANGSEFLIAGHAPLKDGWTFLGPDDAPKGLTHEIWIVPARYAENGTAMLCAETTARMPVAQRKLAEGKGWRYAGPCMRNRIRAHEDIDKRVDIGEGSTMSMREQLQHELDMEAHRIRIGDYVDHNTPKPFFDGTELIRPVSNDADMVKRVHKRGEMPKVTTKDDDE